MNIFVTGVTGKVGSRFVPRLLQRGHKVSVLVRNAAKADMLEQQSVNVIQGDLLQTDSLAYALRGMDVVVHLAAHEAEGVQQPFNPWDMI